MGAVERIVAAISDVARQAGVATSTVSHVLNGTRYVSPETTAAVERAVQAVGYTPNVLARALARSSTNMIGIAMSTTANRYFGDIVNAIEEQCANLGMMVLLANTRDEPSQELKVVHTQASSSRLKVKLPGAKSGNTSGSVFSNSSGRLRSGKSRK